jgi:hypothetical protein
MTNNPTIAQTLNLALDDLEICEIDGTAPFDLNLDTKGIPETGGSYKSSSCCVVIA